MKDTKVYKGDFGNFTFKNNTTLNYDTYMLAEIESRKDQKINILNILDYSCGCDGVTQTLVDLLKDEESFKINTINGKGILFKMTDNYTRILSVLEDVKDNDIIIKALTLSLHEEMSKNKILSLSGDNDMAQILKPNDPTKKYLIFRLIPHRIAGSTRFLGLECALLKLFKGDCDISQNIQIYRIKMISDIEEEKSVKFVMLTHKAYQILKYAFNLIEVNGGSSVNFFISLTDINPSDFIKSIITNKK